MALSRTKIWITGETLFASDLNTEFDSILNNALSLIFPLTGALDADGKEIILDADADSSITADTDNRVDVKLQGVDLFRFDGTVAAPVNGLDFIAAAASSEPSIAAVGSDTDIDIALTPKGAGALDLALGPLNENKGADIASGATTNIGAATGNFLDVTGTTTITALGTVKAGTRRTVQFDGALTLTHNATSLILPGGANITTAAGDVAEFRSLGAGNWLCSSYTRANGTVLVLNIVSDTTPQLGGALDTNSFAINESEGSNVASAATTNIWVTDGNTLHVTGTTTITSFGTAPNAGAWRKVIFDGVLTLTDGANLNLPGAANITTAADDFAFVYAETTTLFKALYFKADGTAVTTLPAAQGSSLALLASASPSAAASVDILSAIVAGYKSFLLAFDNLVPATDDVELWLRTSTNNSTFDSGAGNYEYALGTVNTVGSGAAVNSSSATRILMSDTGATRTVGSAPGEGISGRVWISDPLDTAMETRVQFETFYISAGAISYAARGMGVRESAADVDAVQLLFERGNMESGEVRLYGLKEA